MDTEPGRCRRTDGKKWRCRLAVIPNKKYCLRHLHRGCNRSRKPVEVSNSTTSSNSSAKATPILQSVTGGNAKNQNKVQINDQSYKIKKHSTKNGVTHLESSLSPESVLQHCNAKQCGTSSNTHTGVLTLNDSKRCRKTDGKKWRCSNTVLPEQKYCEKHMCVGAIEDEYRQYLNTSMSFSVGGSYQQIFDEGKQSNDDSSSSSSSDDNNGSDATGATSNSDSSASLCESYLKTASVHNSA